jgi:hypothetical protein
MDGHQTRNSKEGIDKAGLYRQLQVPPRPPKIGKLRKKVADFTFYFSGLNISTVPLHRRAGGLFANSHFI